MLDINRVLAVRGTNCLSNAEREGYFKQVKSILSDYNKKAIPKILLRNLGEKRNDNQGNTG